MPGNRRAAWKSIRKTYEKKKQKNKKKQTKKKGPRSDVEPAMFVLMVLKDTNLPVWSFI